MSLYLFCLDAGYREMRLLFTAQLQIGAVLFAVRLRILSSGVHAAVATLELIACFNLLIFFFNLFNVLCDTQTNG